MNCNIFSIENGLCSSVFKLIVLMKVLYVIKKRKKPFMLFKETLPKLGRLSDSHNKQKALYSSQNIKQET